MLPTEDSFDAIEDSFDWFLCCYRLKIALLEKLLLSTVDSLGAIYSLQLLFSKIWGFWYMKQKLSHI